ncbi:MAG: deoxyribodipyrimidine photo-lyase [Acidimicrobiia bacterium]|nr:deoxyribodipyrimidine photo-lyase [Acidimicrobiia bacterium]
MSHGIVWFRADLRLDDNPAWAAATSAHDEVTALFVVDPPLWDGAGEHRRDQLAAHLAALDAALRDGGGRLRVERGRPDAVVADVASDVDAELVHATTDITPYAVRRDRTVGEALDGRLVGHPGRYVHAPGTITTTSGDPYRVFTPFSRSWASTPWVPWPGEGEAGVASEPGDGLPEAGPPLMVGGEDAALDRLDEFLDRVDAYEEERDRPDLDTTSRLSADLKFGTLSPRMVAVRVGDGTESRRAFVRQLCWRDFYAQLMAHFPGTVDAPMRSEYEAMAWRDDPDGLEAWQEGRTGYPIVDAGMRQLAAEGWMHNRVRMITASFLVKDLLIDWREGERWFRRLLVDADLPQNVGNWQWVAGTGADAAPYFRVFNPVTQSKRFDPDGHYIRRWVPELRGLDGAAIHEPWTAGPLELAAAGITLGEDYPEPLVDHAEARERTLEAYRAARGD